MPTGGAGSCFNAATATCTATACTPPTANISYAGPFCASVTTTQLVNLTGTGTFTGGTFSALPGLNINSSTGAITPSASTSGTYLVTYTVPASGGCPGVFATTSVTIDAVLTPTFNPVASICSGTALAALPTTSLNGITGTWNPALNNTSTTTYTFTPTAGQCAITTTLTITVNPNITPTFNPVAAICSGAALAALPTTSLNGITGTWAPALNNTATTTYTFTPTAGLCATTTTLTITVNPNITPAFNPVAAICSGAALSALPTTSLNGITGTWAPALNNTSTTTYTFAPTTGQCATTTTLTISVNPNVTPAFNPVAAICSGAALSALPTTSLNGITGTWAPALNNTATTTYTFAPTTGQCATTTTLTISVNPNVTPTFNPVAAICSGAVLAALPTTSLNGITGTWAPALNNTATTTYTFTPTAGQCATTTTLTISVNPNVTPAFNPIGSLCQNSTAPILPATSNNGITGTWNPAMISTASVGTITYTFTASAGQCATSATLNVTIATQITPVFTTIGPLCQNSTAPLLPAISNNGINGTWSPAIISTATIGTGTYTFTPATGQCATASVILNITIAGSITPTFNPVAAICSGDALAALPTTSLNGITGAWSPALNNTATTTYTFTPTAGQCAATVTLTITVNPVVTPTFNPVAPICAGDALAALPTISLNGIAGAWLPALNNTATTTYTFTPTAGQCAATASLTITVNPNTTPTFNPVASICAGDALAALPTISLNGIAGAWSPALNNTATITYTFTPAAGQCAATTTLTITVNPIVTPTFNPIAAICAGDALAALPTTSLNGITGVWSPALNNTVTTTYTFTPTAGQCAATTTLAITVNPGIAPAFNPIGALCQNSTAPLLPATSNNGISGTWSPAVINTSTVGTSTYTFTPAAGQCASSVTLNVTIATQITAVFTAIGPLCVNATPPPLPAISNNGITGTWSPATINTATAGTNTYTFTPSTGQCATSATTLNVTVTTSIVPAFNTVAAICAGDALAPLPATSLNGITGTWLPAVNNNTTTTYTFTPAAGQCASTSTLSITVNPNITPIFSTVGFLCQNSTPAALPLISNNGITGMWNPATINTSTVGTSTYTFTPAAGQCATSATLNVTIATQITPVFTAIAPLCQNSTTPLLPATSNNGINGTWNPATINTATTGTITYTFTPTAGQCATAAVTTNVTVTAAVTPTFNPVAAICSGIALAALPTTSLNGITGTWNPALNNTATTTYTFTPTAGQCAATTTLTINVNPASTPTFNPVPAICAGAALNALPTTSLNGITGSWSPALNNTATTTYTFTPAAGQCAVSTTLMITVNPASTPTFNPVATICAGAALNPLPTTSLNGITGTWSPALNNTATTTYTFTPAAGQCAATTTLTITISPKLTPTFTPVAAICTGSALAALPTTSLNGIAGTWSPALNNTATTTYTFSTAAGQCATGATLIITVNPALTPTFNPVAAICTGATLMPLLTRSFNGITGTWSPAVNNTTTTTYTFTPDAGQCAATTTLDITVNPAPIIFAGNDTIISINEPFTLHPVDVNNAGFTTYLWSPPDGLNNPFIQNPVSVLNNDATYVVTATTANGCEATDAINIRINRTAEIYVPSAFTPGGNNPLLHAIPVGIKTFHYFAIYNRWGQEVFKTNNPAVGWNGIYKGILQNSAGYVWIAEGIDFRNRIISRKGNIVLIR
ncbi:MAG: gliding motility-associated C-terminal domain-containing protein [Chitinophagaceae bacterium]|nr:gliding motility-associated C-terminal domain-containing protein [Chitinophagaceae bacterium]